MKFIIPRFVFFICVILFFGILCFSGCRHEDKSFIKDVAALGDARCRFLEVSNKLLATAPQDVANFQELKSKLNDLDKEMTTLNAEFKSKYGKKMTDPGFIKDFKTEIRRSMLNCKFLSKEDREIFMKEVEE